MEMCKQTDEMPWIMLESIFEIVCVNYINNFILTFGNIGNEWICDKNYNSVLLWHLL